MKNNKDLGVDSTAIHGGNRHTNFGEHIFPIFQTATFLFENADQGAKRFAGEDNGYIYSRLGNPTVSLFEKKLALLEEGGVCRAYSTGMGAISSVLLGLLNQGDHLLTESFIYGCTDSLFRNQLSRFGIEVEFMDKGEPEEVEKKLKKNTKVVFLETPSNPTMNVFDIAAISKIVHGCNPKIKVVVDNTFATPIYQKPLKMGADIVIHSCTKYICGHGDSVSGAAVFGKEIEEQLTRAQSDLGTTMSPFDSWLLIRGLKTLPLRMKKHTQNAKKVVEFLKGHNKIENVKYPGFSGMIAFELKGGIKSGKALLDNVKMIGLCVSLGNVDSLIQHPASMTHAIVPKKQREKVGITDGLVRISVGIENAEDIISDLEQALEKA